METGFDALIIRFLGEDYRGRRYLRYAELHALGVASTRASLRDWIEKGAFPAPIRIASKYGTTLVWPAVEVAQHLAECFAERDAPPPHEEGAPLSETRLLCDRPAVNRPAKQ